MNQLDVISGRGGVLDAAIMENIGDTLSRYGIELVSVETKHLDLPDDNKNFDIIRIYSASPAATVFSASASACESIIAISLSV